MVIGTRRKVTKSVVRNSVFSFSGFFWNSEFLDISNVYPNCKFDLPIFILFLFLVCVGEFCSLIWVKKRHYNNIIIIENKKYLLYPSVCLS